MKLPLQLPVWEDASGNYLCHSATVLRPKVRMAARGEKPTRRIDVGFEHREQASGSPRGCSAR
eukprot:4053515-Alexandrium_andersonii.AAC.2